MKQVKEKYSAGKQKDEGFPWLIHSTRQAAKFTVGKDGLKECWVSSGERVPTVIVMRRLGPREVTGLLV